jgi:hypothetical protein
MRVIVAGGRFFNDYEAVKRMLDSRKSLITEVVSGAAKGADTLGERWAKENGIPVKRFPADWNRQPDGSYDKGAGHKRNEQMARYADALIAFPGGDGTDSMIRLAKKYKLPRLEGLDNPLFP